MEDGEIAESPVHDEQMESFQSSEEAVHDISRNIEYMGAGGTGHTTNNTANPIRNIAGSGFEYDHIRRQPSHGSSSEHNRSAGKNLYLMKYGVIILR